MNAIAVTVSWRLRVSDRVRAITLHLFWSFLILTFRFGV